VDGEGIVYAGARTDGSGVPEVRLGRHGCRRSNSNHPAGRRQPDLVRQKRAAGIASSARGMMGEMHDH
jgi:hypothetical protein